MRSCTIFLDGLMKLLEDVVISADDAAQDDPNITTANPAAEADAHAVAATEIQIYILQLQEGKYYVGQTKNLEKRLKQHWNGQGSTWTQLYKPLTCLKVITQKSPYDEHNYTLEYMKEYGIDSVRGASFCEILLDDVKKKTIEEIIQGQMNVCYKCKKEGHYARECDFVASTEATRKGTKWTVEEEATLLKLLTEAKTYYEIAEILSRSVNGIEQRLRKMILQKLKLNDNNYVKTSYEMQLSTEEITRLLRLAEIKRRK